MDEGSSEMHSEDDKTQLEKNKKRTVKTRAQVQALEKFYNEHKYPTESMKLQLAESIGLTEKQVSGWFCHRRLKDKRLLNGDNHLTGKQDRSNGVIQDRGSGHRQDSCGSTKQGDDRNFDSREVESGRFTGQEYSAAELTYELGAHYTGNHNNMEDPSSGSSSSLRNMSNHHSGDQFDAASSRYQIPKFPADAKTVKGRSGPSGYLKLKGQVENSAITAVKRQLGKLYREDGPPLGIEFDPLPPGAFETSVQDPVDETNYSREAALPALPDVPKIRHHPKSSKGSEYGLAIAPQVSILDRTGFKMTPGSETPDNYVAPKFRQNTVLPNSAAYYPRRNFSVELTDGSAREMIDVECRDEYGMKPRQGAEFMRKNMSSGHYHQQPYTGKVRVEQDSWFQKYKDVDTKTPRGENIEDEPPTLTRRGYEYLDPSQPKGLSRQITKDGSSFTERRIANENRPFRKDITAAKRTRDEFPPLQRFKRSSMVEDQQGAYRTIRSGAEVPSSFSEDEESAETSSSVD